MRHDLRTVASKRLDAFVDAAFAFAATMLVIATTAPPDGVEELTKALGRVPAFAVSLSVVIMFWLAHRRFGALTRARDAISDAISITIVFVVMIYVYPLRLLAESALHWATGAWLPGRGLLAEDVRLLFVIYGAGFAALALLYALLFAHAAQPSARLGATDLGRIQARHSARRWSLAFVSGGSSVVLALLSPAAYLPILPALAYLLIPLGLCAPISEATRVAIRGEALNGAS